MVRQLTVTQVKAQILSLLNDVAGGEEIEIAKRERTVARLVPAAGPASLRSRLADTFPGDPADQLIYATAIETGWQLVTKDARMSGRRHTHPITIW